MTDTDRSLESDSCPVFNPAFVPVQVTPDELHIRSGPWSGPALTIRDTDREGLLGQLVDAIDGETTVASIIDTFEAQHRDEVRSILDRLAANDVLRNRASVNGDQLWPHRALKYRFRQADRTPLRDRSVLVVTCDDMGRHVVSDLCSMGVGSIDVTQPYGEWVAIDDDRVIYHEDPSLPALVEENDVVVYTADRPRPLVSDLNRLAIDTSTPLFPIEIHGFDGIVGPAIFPGETACYRCFRDRMRANVPGKRGYEAYERTLDADEEITTASLPPFARMLAGVAAMELHHLLAFGTGYSAGRVLTIDSLELSIEANDVLKRPRCECCGAAAEIDVQRFVSMEDVVEAGRLSDRGEEPQGQNRDEESQGQNRDGEPQTNTAARSEVEAE